MSFCRGFSSFDSHSIYQKLRRGDVLALYSNPRLSPCLPTLSLNSNEHTHAQVNYAHEQSKNIRSFLFSTWPRHFRHFRALVFSIGRRLAVVQKVADYDADAVAAVQLRKGQRTMGQNQVILKH